MKKIFNSGPFSAVPRLTGRSFPQTRWLTGGPAGLPLPTRRRPRAALPRPRRPPPPAKRPSVRPLRAAPGPSRAAPPSPSAPASLPRAAQAPWALPEPRPDSPAAARRPLQAGGPHGPSGLHGLPSAPQGREWRRRPPGRTFPRARPECASAITVPRSALAAASGPRGTPGRSPAVPSRPPGGTCGPVPRGRGPHTTQLRSLARPRRSRCLRHTRCAHGPSAHPAPPLCARLAGARLSQWAQSGAKERPMGAADGDTQPWRPEGGRGAPPARWRGSDGGSLFALLSRDSPPASACTAHTAARAQSSPGSGGAVPHTPKRLAEALDPASLLPVAARPGLVTPLRAVTRCCTEEPHSSVPHGLPHRLQRETCAPLPDPPGTCLLPIPRQPPPAGTPSNFRPAPRAAPPGHFQAPVPRSAEPAGLERPWGSAWGRGERQRPHPALSRPSGAAAILAGRGHRRGAGNGGRGSVTAPGLPPR